MSDQWYISRGGEQRGPYTWEEVLFYGNEGNIDPEDLIWSRPTGEWLRADQVPGLLPGAASRGAPTHGGLPARFSRKKIALIAGVALLMLLPVIIFFTFFRAPNVEAVARKVEKALLASDLDALVALTYPSQREALRATMAASVEDMPKLGENFADRKLIATDGGQVLYEVNVDGDEFFVEFILLGRAWWLWVQ